MPERESLSRRVVRKVAAREETDPTALEPPLHAVVDTEALDGLFRSADPDETVTRGAVAFEYRGYTIHVDSAGGVRVDESASPTEAETHSATDSMAD